SQSSRGSRTRNIAALTLLAKAWRCASCRARAGVRSGSSSTSPLPGGARSAVTSSATLPEVMARRRPGRRGDGRSGAREHGSALLGEGGEGLEAILAAERLVVVDALELEPPLEGDL